MHRVPSACPRSRARVSILSPPRAHRGSARRTPKRDAPRPRRCIRVRCERGIVCMRKLRHHRGRRSGWSRRHASIEQRGVLDEQCRHRDRWYRGRRRGRNLPRDVRLASSGGCRRKRRRRRIDRRHVRRAASAAVANVVERRSESGSCSPPIERRRNGGSSTTSRTPFRRRRAHSKAQSVARSSTQSARRPPRFRALSRS